MYVQNVKTGKVIREDHVVGTSYTPPDALASGDYRVWVQAVSDENAAGFWSVAQDFSVPVVTKIISPILSATTALSVFPEITWEPVAGAARYEIWVNDLTAGVVRVITQQNLTTTSYKSTDGPGSGSYRAFVRAFDSNNKAGPWSPGFEFTVLAAPQIVLPEAGNSFEQRPLLTWSAVPGARLYDVWVTSKTLNKIVIRHQSVADTSFRVPSNLSFGEYTVWVRALSGSLSGVWSVGRQFSVGTPPKISSPDQGSTTENQPQITWTGVTGTGRYELWISNAATRARVSYVTDLTATTFRPNPALTAGKYRVWIRAVSKGGEVTAWSTPLDFTVTSVAPAKTHPDETPLPALLMPAIPQEPIIVVVEDPGIPHTGVSSVTEVEFVDMFCQSLEHEKHPTL